MAMTDTFTPARDDFTRDHVPGWRDPFDLSCPECGGDGLDDPAGPCQRCVTRGRVRGVNPMKGGGA
jgi:hypothetical protein